jgi:hypothetical protein
MINRVTYWIYILAAIFTLTGCEGEQPDIVKESTGIVKDYSGLDGCGFIIELSDGTKLEPFYLDSSFIFEDDQHVLVEYAILEDHASICMVGYPARIYSVREISCMPLEKVSLDFNIESLPDDPFEVDTVLFSGDCMDVVLWYSGGCKIHEFRMVELPLLSGTPPVPPPTLLLSHQANKDACEAYIRETVSIDLTGLQKQDTSMVRFILTLHIPNSTYSKEFIYEY